MSRTPGANGGGGDVLVWVAVRWAKPQGACRPWLGESVEAVERDPGCQLLTSMRWSRLVIAAVCPIAALLGEPAVAAARLTRSTDLLVERVKPAK